MVKRLSKALLLAFTALMMLSTPALAYLYRVPISITETGSNAYDMLGIRWDASNTFMANNGFMLPTARDTRVQTLGGLNKPHLVADNKTLVATAIGANSQTNLYFVTGESEQDMSIITGAGGYVTTPDHASLEISGNGSIKTQAYLLNDSCLAEKADAYTLCYDSATENVTFTTLAATSVTQDSNDDSVLMYTGANTRAGQRINSFPVSTIQDVQFYLSKSGTPTGTASVVVRRVSDDAIIGTLGTLDVSTLTGSNAWYVFTTDVDNPTIQDLRLSFEYSGTSDSSNYVIVRIQLSDVTAGYRFYYIGSYTDSATQDSTIRYTYVEVDTTLTATGVTAGERTVEVSMPTRSTSPYVENLTTYTEQDAGGFISANATRVTATAATSQTDTYLYYDYGTDYFDGFIIDFDINVAGDAVSPFGWGGIALSNTVDDISGMSTTDIIFGGQSRNASDVWLRLGDGNFFTISTWTSGVSGTTYYIRMERQPGADTVYAYIYTDAARTDRIATLSLSGLGATKYRYSYAFANLNSGTANRFFSGWIQNIQERHRYLAIDIDGNLAAEQLLNNLTIPDTSSDIVWFNGLDTYAEYAEIKVGGSQKLYYAPNAIIQGTTLPDRSGNANHGTITWGSNPAGVSVSMGSMTSSGQTLITATENTPSRDVLTPDAPTSSWSPGDGTITKAATLANPFRVVITTVSDNTTLTEIQVWRWTGAALLMFLVVLVGSRLRGHQGITAITASVLVGGMVAFDSSIFPFWLLAFTVGGIIVGILAERSPSL